MDKGISNLDQSFGELVTNSMNDLGWQKDRLSETIDYPAGIMDAILSDKIYPNCIPLLLMVKMIQLLCINTEEIIPSFKNTYNILKRNESPDRYKQEPWAALWENTESLGKYVKRLLELLTTQTPKQ